MRNKLIILFVGVALLSGCATTQMATEARQPIYLDESFQSIMTKEIYIVPVIDTVNNTGETVEDIKDVPDYDNVQKFSIVNKLKEKGYSPIELDVDSKGCRSVAGIQNIDDLNCPFNLDHLPDGNILLLSIDDYTPPAKLSTTASGVLSGVIYSNVNNKILWRDTIQFKSQGQIKTLGLAAFVVKGMLKTYKAYVFGGFGELFRSLPNPPLYESLRSPVRSPDMGE